MTPPTHSNPNGLTSALEDYLETILQLVNEQSFARVKDIASARDVKAASVSPALKRLADMGMVNYARREYVTLTEKGEAAARRVYARHRILSRFFEKVLQMPHAAAEAEACAMEHSLSNEGMERLVRFFEFLVSCPESSNGFLERFHQCSLVHGDGGEFTCHCEQAGTEHCQLVGGSRMSVYELAPGQSGQVMNVGSQGAIRQRLLDMGILPNATITMARVAPAGDPVWIELDGTQLALRRPEAESILVERQ
jgi:DtxR family Mn-dependent transcriptional regulator